MANICYFHSAVILANLGRYGPALDAFRNAVKCDPWDCESLAYIPEIMFLGHLGPFDQVIQTFERAIEQVEHVPSEVAEKFSEPKESLLATLRLKLANCFMADCHYADYRQNRNLENAEGHLQAALQSAPTSLFARFSLAQILWQNKRDPEKQIALFAGVFHETREVVTRITEPKILMMYYYILLISSSLGHIPNDNPTLYAMRIRELEPQLPKTDELRLFSPYSKTDLLLPEFREEVRRFEGQWASPSTDPPAVRYQVSAQAASGSGEANEPLENRPARRNGTIGPSLLKM